jgi:putative ABC transport system permease protein
VIPAAAPELRTRTVIGIARDSKYLAVFEHPLPFVYLAMKQDPPSSMRVVFIRSSSIPPDTLATRLEGEIHRLDPEMPIADLKTMRQMLHGGLDLLLMKLGAIQAAAMGLLGLLLAVVGIYGVVSYATTQRTREIGIRIALGAKPAAVGWMLIGHGARLVLAGIALGMITAVLATRAIGRFFFFIAPTDPSTFAAVAALLAVVALVACYLPARRAMRVSPIIALRHE